MSAEKQRKEVKLSKEVLKGLAKLADKDGRKLQNYMEKVLIDHLAASSEDKNKNQTNGPL